VPAPAPATPPAPTPAIDRSLAGCVTAFFDMLDFCRTEGWGRKSVTPTAARARATRLLEQYQTEIDPETMAAIRKLPDVWAALREKWAEASEEDRRRQREHWRGQLLLPNPLLPPPEGLTRFRSEAGHHEFDYPAGWLREENRVEDTGLLFLAPPGTTTTWEQVVNPATCPPGVLFLIAPVEEGLRAAGNVVAGARYLVRKYILPGAPGMREVATFPAGPGAIVVLRGKYPGRAEESFLWLGAMPFGNDKFLAGRFGGPVARAEELLPIFSTMLATMEVTPPDDLVDLQLNLAASIIGNAVINSGWSH
jgi:hypothetical protein